MLATTSGSTASPIALLGIRIVGKGLRTGERLRLGTLGAAHNAFWRLIASALGDGLVIAATLLVAKVAVGLPKVRHRIISRLHRATLPKSDAAQALPRAMRYLAHGVVVALALLVAVAGNLGQSVADWRPLALDRAAGMPSAFVSIERQESDALVKPPTPLTQVVNQPRQGVTTYKVGEGDTISDIADRYQISIATILWANGLEEDGILEIGKSLVILPVSGILHTAQPGETVQDIAARYQSDPRAIVEFNQLTDPERVVANDLLVVPGGRRLERQRPVPIDRAQARPPEQRPAPEAAIRTYTVERGDTLNGIAARFGVSAETLMWANGLQNTPERLAEGQKLTILPMSGALYELAEGETLLHVAQRFGVEVEQIAAANSITELDKVGVGQKLIVPGAKLMSADEVRASAAAQARAAAAVKHTVSTGDSLLAIAQRYGVDAPSIVRANGLASADFLVVGQQLAIPGARAIVVAAPSEPAPQPALAPAPKPAPAASPAPQPAQPPSAGGARIVSAASRYLGYAYAWGGHSPKTGFDCSGFVWYAFQEAGIKLPIHDLWGQLQAGPRIGRDNLQPGDIVFFQNTYKAGLSHNGIYIGGGRFINAEDYGKGVRVANMNDSYWSSRFFGASRPW